MVLVRAAVTWLVVRFTVTSAKGWWTVGRGKRVPGSWAGICWSPSAGGVVDPPVSWVSAQVWSRVGMLPGIQTGANPGGLPKSVFDDLQAQVAANRSVFYRALPSGAVYGFNPPGVTPVEAIIENWWRQGMMGGAKAQYDGIVAFSQTDFTEDLKGISVPGLVQHGADDQIVPYADSGPLSAKLVKNGTLKSYPGFPHGMPTTEAATINADLLAWLQA